MGFKSTKIQSTPRLPGKVQAEATRPGQAHTGCLTRIAGAWCSSQGTTDSRARSRKQAAAESHAQSGNSPPEGPPGFSAAFGV